MSRSLSKAVLPVLVVLGVFFVLLPFAATAKDIPPLTGRIVDQANLLTADQKQRIETKLAAFEKETTDQVAVLTLDSLEGEALEDYANKVGRAWALGQKGKDNGVLLLVAKQDRKMRMEVGYGLEPVLTDLQTNIIQNEVIIPYFKKGDFGGGIEAGVDAILSTIQGKPFQPAPEPAGGQPARGKGGPDFGFLFFALFILLPFSMSAARSRSWFLYLLLMPIYFFLGTLVNVTVGLVALGVWAVLFPILRAVLPKSLGRSGRGGPGGWFMGPGFGGGGGGGWSGGGGGGGFSGGGGSFGGGGSSSSW
ncbi:MAG TPA: TPM domain-containing protein [Thermoanaerobaculia bacterium]|jgi:uncharacterized protein|nr:TPM domain-containing protein [Thermoanaerobaculia bacterium]